MDHAYWNRYVEESKKHGIKAALGVSRIKKKISDALNFNWPTKIYAFFKVITAKLLLIKKI